MYSRDQSTRAGILLLRKGMDCQRPSIDAFSIGRQSAYHTTVLAGCHRARILLAVRRCVIESHQIGTVKSLAARGVTAARTLEARTEKFHRPEPLISIISDRL